MIHSFIGIHSTVVTIVFRIEMYGGFLCGLALALIAGFVPFILPDPYATVITKILSIASDMSTLFWYENWSDWHLNRIPTISLIVTIYNQVQPWLLDREYRRLLKDADSKVLDVKKYTPEGPMITKLLEKKETYILFKQFAVAEFNSENIFFWESIQKYKRIKKPESKYRHAKKTLETYLNSNSPLEINVTNVQKMPVRQAVDAYEKNKEAILGEEIFEACETGVISNLLDTYSRFFKSSPFQRYLGKL